MSDKKRFASKAVHSGTQHIEGAVNTPIFQSSTYQLTDERYEGWAMALNTRYFTLDFLA